MSRLFYIMLPVCLVLALAACGSGVRESLGLKKKAPDEFMVIARPALSLPPDYNLVTPEEAAAARESSVKEEAEKTLLGERKLGAGTKASAGEDTLLKKAGADRAKPDIRAVLEEERGAMADGEEGDGKGIIDTLTPDKKEPIVDAEAEKKRLAKNKKEGKPVNEGDVPTVTPKGKTPLQKITGSY